MIEVYFIRCANNVRLLHHVVRFSLLMALLLPLASNNAVAQEWKPLPVNDPAFASLRSGLAAMQSIEGNIRQEKAFAFLEDKLVSNGTFSYKKDNRLRWQFTDPIDYVILISGNAMRLREEGKEKQYKGVDKILRQVKEIILGCIDGSIINNPNYRTSFYGHASGLKLELQPKDKQLREFIQRIEVEFFKKDARITSVIITDPSGDVTHIHFSDIRTGQPINESIFTDF